MRAWFQGIVVLSFLIVVTGCGRKESGTGSGKRVIAVVPKGTTHEFWKSVHAGAVKASREDSIEIIWKGPLKEDDREAQISVVEDFVSRGVSGIVLAPLDDAALRQPVANAARAGIAVVIIDSDLKGSDFVSFVATDNYRGGQLAGEHMIHELNGAGRIIMLRYQEGSASTTNREQGFLDAVRQAPGIQVVSANQYAGATTEAAYRASENLLAPLKGKGNALTIDGIFTPNESSTFGMLRALQDGGYAGSIRFIGFDSSPKLIEALRSGHIHALVVQNPLRMGYLGVKTMVAHLRGNSVDKRVDTGVTLITRTMMDNPEIRSLLQPDIAEWLQ